MSTEYIDFNLNNNILVELNEDGYNHWAKQHNKVYVECMDFFKTDKFKENIKDIEYFKSKKREDGYVKFQGWEFMEIFGEETGMGKKMLFNTNIKIEINN